VTTTTGPSCTSKASGSLGGELPGFDDVLQRETALDRRLHVAGSDVERDRGLLGLQAVLLQRCPVDQEFFTAFVLG
jgi:hypothetical protein